MVDRSITTRTLLSSLFNRCLPLCLQPLLRKNSVTSNSHMSSPTQILRYYCRKRLQYCNITKKKKRKNDFCRAYSLYVYIMYMFIWCILMLIVRQIDCSAAYNLWLSWLLIMWLSWLLVVCFCILCTGSSGCGTMSETRRRARRRIGSCLIYDLWLPVVGVSKTDIVNLMRFSCLFARNYIHTKWLVLKPPMSSWSRELFHH